MISVEKLTNTLINEDKKQVLQKIFLKQWHNMYQAMERTVCYSH
jgi:hypothetical protein